MKTKNLFAQTMMGKRFGTKYINLVKTGQEKKKEKFDIYFCMFFDCYYRSLISGRATGH